MEEKLHEGIPKLQEQLRQGKITRREFLRYVTLLGASLATAQALAACAPAATPTPTPKPPPTPTPVPPTPTPVPPTPTPVPVGPKYGGTLNYAETGSFSNFNPWRVAGTAAAMYNQVFSRLMWKDLEGNLHGDLAKDWEMAPDGLSVKIKLHENIKWHDGKECTSQDFVDQIGYTRDEELQEYPEIQEQSGLVQPIKDIKVLDKYTFEFIFDTPMPMGYFTEITDYWWAIRIEDKEDIKFTKTLPVGTGPFKITEWVPNEYSRYVKYPEYHIEGLPYLDEWVFKRLEKRETLLPNLEAGSVDGVFQVSLSDLPIVEENPEFQRMVTSGHILHIVVNTHKPPFDKKEVRQALSYSMNREAFVKIAAFGQGIPTCTPFYSPTSLGYRENLVMAYPFDLDKAAKLLEQAGVKDLEMDIHTRARNPQMTPFCLMWKEDLAEIGVKLNVYEVENARFGEIGRDGNLLGFGVHAWASGRCLRDAGLFMATQTPWRGDPSVNRFAWKNDELEKLVAEGVAELDPEERRKIYQRINEILVEELPQITVMTDPRNWVVHKDVKGFTVDLDFMINLYKTWVDR